MANKYKAHWHLIVDVPICVLMSPFIVLGAVWAIVEIGWTFGHYHMEQHFTRSYKLKGDRP